MATPKLWNDFSSFQAAWCVEQVWARFIPDWSWLKGMLSFFIYLVFSLCFSVLVVFCFFFLFSRLLVCIYNYMCKKIVC